MHWNALISPIRPRAGLYDVKLGVIKVGMVVEKLKGSEGGDYPPLDQAVFEQDFGELTNRYFKWASYDKMDLQTTFHYVENGRVCAANSGTHTNTYCGIKTEGSGNTICWVHCENPRQMQQFKYSQNLTFFCCLLVISRIRKTICIMYACSCTLSLR